MHKLVVSCGVGKTVRKFHVLGMDNINATKDDYRQDGKQLAELLWQNLPADTIRRMIDDFHARFVDLIPAIK